MNDSKRSWVHGRSSTAHLVRVVVHGTRRLVRALHRLYLGVNPNRAELEAFREIVALEAKLVDYPYAVPILERLSELYRMTGEGERRMGVMRRLRDEPELPNFPAPVLRLVAENEPSRELLFEKYYPRAVDFARHMGFCSPTQLMMEFKVGYNLACGICELLTDRGVLEPPVQGCPCQSVR